MGPSKTSLSAKLRQAAKAVILLAVGVSFGWFLFKSNVQYQRFTPSETYSIGNLAFGLRGVLDLVAFPIGFTILGLRYLKQEYFDSVFGGRQNTVQDLAKQKNRWN